MSLCRQVAWENSTSETEKDSNLLTDKGPLKDIFRRAFFLFRKYNITVPTTFFIDKTLPMWYFELPKRLGKFIEINIPAEGVCTRYLSKCPVI
jgi:hypothetical protein